MYPSVEDGQVNQTPIESSELKDGDILRAVESVNGDASEMVHRHDYKTGGILGPLRAPWVPAPAKASNNSAISNDPGVSHKGLSLASTSSSVSDSHIQRAPAGLRNTGARSSQTSITGHKHRRDKRKYVRKPLSKVKNVKHSGRPASGYKLQSKDSLVDVTACLQAKREEVMKLWERNLVKDDPALLSQIEKANRLSLEAAEEVETLRKTIQDMQMQNNGLSDADCLHLERMRTKVLEKVKEFEQADNGLQESMTKKSASRVSLASGKSRTSQTDHHYKSRNHASGHSTAPESASEAHKPLNQVAGNHNQHELIFLKHKSDDYDNDPKSDYEANFTSRKQQNFQSDKSSGPSRIASIDNIHHKERKKEFRGDHFLRENVFDKTVTTARNTHHDYGSARTVRFMDTQGSLPESEVGEEYTSKILNLQRNIMDTEQEVEDLRAEMERIESDASFRVRFLENAFQDKLQSLHDMPECLEMFGQKLHELVDTKSKLEYKLQEKDMHLQDQVSRHKVTEGKCVELQEKLRTAQNSNDILQFKNNELQNSNQQLRNQLENLTKQVSAMTIQNQTPERDGYMNSDFSSSESWLRENQKLKLKCSELKEQVAQSNRFIQSLKKSKAKLVAGLNDKIEELLNALEQCQDHKRQLCDQIRFLKKSYLELFPTDLGPPPASKYSQKRTIRHTKRPSVLERKIESKVTWKTGENGPGSSVPPKADVSLNTFFQQLDGLGETV